MFWSFYSTKGGVGTSVVAAAAALEAARSAKVCLVDLAGDQPDLIGVEPGGPEGVCDWLAADGDVDASALKHISVSVDPTLEIIPAGRDACPPAVAAGRCTQLVETLSVGYDLVIADLGTTSGDAFSTKTLIAASGDRTSLVIRACYLALKRASRSSILPDDVIEVVEGGRALRTLDIEAVIGREVCARIAVDPRIARSVDAGLVGSRLPRALRRLARDLAGRRDSAAA